MAFYRHLSTSIHKSVYQLTHIHIFKYARGMRLTIKIFLIYSSVYLFGLCQSKNPSEIKLVDIGVSDVLERFPKLEDFHFNMEKVIPILEMNLRYENKFIFSFYIYSKVETCW